MPHSLVNVQGINLSPLASVHDACCFTTPAYEQDRSRRRKAIYPDLSHYWLDWLLTPFKHLQAAVLFVGAAVMFMPDQARAAIPASWCTHSSAQWLTGDVDGDGRLDFELFDITRALGGGYILHVRNNGIVGNLETVRCTPITATRNISRRIEAGAVATVVFLSTRRDAVPTCSVGGRGVSDAEELFISNNQLSKFVP
ncbi:hypothetical protein [Massilia rubra]|uniref:VCBS repeat-containing protein n=1 Tax=Massilia rubra TaxID=2607910 RepID=A0ABX0LIP5_9BURK|nr:hypothetical protein [Massilia rubra]NHZ34010.1 hypothetical protein [Massilia rubra]